MFAYSFQFQWIVCISTLPASLSLSRFSNAPHDTRTVGRRGRGDDKLARQQPADVRGRQPEQRTHALWRASLTSIKSPYYDRCVPNERGEIRCCHRCRKAPRKPDDLDEALRDRRQDTRYLDVLSQLTRIDPASFTLLRIVSGALTLWLIVRIRIGRGKNTAGRRVDACRSSSDKGCC